MLKHGEKNKVCVLHPTNFSRKKRLFFSRLYENQSMEPSLELFPALLYLPVVLLLLGWAEISWEIAA